MCFSNVSFCNWRKRWRPQNIFWRSLLAQAAPMGVSCGAFAKEGWKDLKPFPNHFWHPKYFAAENCKKLAPLFKYFLKRFPLTIFGHKVRYTFYWTNEHVLDCCKHFLPLPINRNIAKGTTDPGIDWFWQLETHAKSCPNCMQWCLRGRGTVG